MGIPALVAASCGAIYLSCLHPALPGGDSGELMLAASAEPLGSTVPHPPGYPVFTILYHGLGFQLPRWILVTLGSRPDVWHEVQPRCLHAVSALLMTGAVCCLHSALSTLHAVMSPGNSSVKMKRAEQFVVSLLVAALAFSRPMLEAATTTEVFALHYFFLSFFLTKTMDYLAFTMKEGKTRPTREADDLHSPRLVPAELKKLSVAAGLCMTNQHLSLFALIPVAATCLVMEARRSLRLTRLLGRLGTALVLSMVVALLPYVLFLVVMAESGTSDYYGWGLPALGVDRFWTHVLRREYGTWQLHAGGYSGGVNDGANIHDATYTKLVAHASWCWRTSPAQFALIGTTFVACTLRLLRPAPSEWRVLLATATLPIVASVPVHVLSNLPTTATGGVYQHVFSRIWGQTLVLALPCAGCCALLCTRRASAKFLAGLLLVAVAHQGYQDHVADPAAVLRGLVPIDTMRSVPFLFAEGVNNAFREIHNSSSKSRDLKAQVGSTSAPLPTSMLVTSGDAYVTSLRFVLRTMSPSLGEGRRGDDSVLHIDRELFTYPWAKHKLLLNYPQVPWPEKLFYTEDGALSRAFTNMAWLGDAVLPQGVRLFALETPFVAKEDPHWKETLQVEAFGWFYEFRKKTANNTQEHCPKGLSKAARAWGRSRHPSKKKEETELLRQVSLHVKATLNKGGLAHFRAKAGSGLLYELVVSEEHYADLQALFPWEMTVLESFHIAERSALLQVAQQIQTCVTPHLEGKKGSPGQAEQLALARAYLIVKEELMKRVFVPLLPKKLYDVVVLPFYKMLVTGVPQVEVKTK